MVHNLRDFTTDRHKVVDDVPFGGGPGMVMKPEPFVAAVEAIAERARAAPGAVVLMSPAGTPFTQADAGRFARARPHRAAVRPLRGRRRARARARGDRGSVDRRLRAVGRRGAGARGRRRGGPAGAGRGRRRAVGGRGFVQPRDCSTIRTTRGRRSSAGWKVPDVLLSGHHGEIRRWRQREAMRRTAERRPELLAAAALDARTRICCAS